MVANRKPGDTIMGNIFIKSNIFSHRIWMRLEVFPLYSGRKTTHAWVCPKIGYPKNLWFIFSL